MVSAIAGKPSYEVKNKKYNENSNYLEAMRELEHLISIRLQNR